ncbi:MAG: TIGR02679 family protein [Acidobacteriota bacterium]|nr:TIGR02679 family protein [Acidobacteriota bacterium]
MDEKRLGETLGAPELSRLVDRIHKRLARGGNSRGKMTLSDATDEERNKLGSLLGKPLPYSARLNVDLSALDEMLRHAQICDGLEAAVTRLRGPLVDPRAERARSDRAWAKLFEKARQTDSRPEVQAWLLELEERHLLRRMADDLTHAGTLLEKALAAAAELPADGMLLKELATLIAGDAHALDEGHRLTALIKLLAQHMTQSERPEHSGERRALWHAVGLVPDEVSGAVLVLGLDADPDSFTGKILAQYAREGEPCRLSLRQLKQSRPRFKESGKLYLCENPAVVQAAAMCLEQGHAPLICLDGQPKTAGHLLLEYLKEAGFSLHYHGDFDWPGIAIANQVIERHNARPWRMSVKDYLTAPASLPLNGEPVTPFWDPALGREMQQRNLAVHEEAVLNLLLADLNQ